MAACIYRWRLLQGYVSFQDAEWPIFVICLEEHLATVSAESFTFSLFYLYYGSPYQNAKWHRSFRPKLTESNESTWRGWGYILPLCISTASGGPFLLESCLPQQISSLFPQSKGRLFIQNILPEKTNMSHLKLNPLEGVGYIPFGNHQLSNSSR